MDFLHFWGKYSELEIRKMPTYRRNTVVERVKVNIKSLFGGK